MRIPFPFSGCGSRRLILRLNGGLSKHVDIRIPRYDRYIWDILVSVDWRGRFSFLGLCSRRVVRRLFKRLDGMCWDNFGTNWF
jgi:hypothetical protein